MGPETRGGTTVHLMVYVTDVDAVVARAVAAGAKVVREIEDKFYGDRSGSLEDPFGHVWHFATHKEDLSKAQLRKRAEQAAKG
jgi:PhnB protein